MNSEEKRKQFLVDLAKIKMPYGKYKDYFLIDLPQPYLTWYHSKGFPKGKIGEMLATVYEIKINGLEYLIQNIKKMNNN